MTENQIKYAELLEKRRANQATEALTELRDSRSYEIGLGNLEELKRSNLEKERLNRANLDETSRHNVSMEDLNLRSVQEVNRANRAREAETIRSNLASEIELKRANVAREAENYRSNYAREIETNRTNLANEAIRRQSNAIASQQVQLGYANLAETRRSNVEQESIARRRNEINYMSTYAQNRDMSARRDEQHRANLANESIRQGQLAEEIRRNQAQEAELNRHNLMMEDIAVLNAFSGATGTAIRGFGAAASFGG